MYKIKTVFFLLLSLIISSSYATEAQSAITTELIETFVKEGETKLLDWCACKTSPKPNRINFTEQFMHIYAKNYPKNEPLVVTFFASGYRFLQEYTLLRSLDAEGFQHITPIFIDPELKEKQGPSWINKFEKILREYPSIKKRHYLGSSIEYLERYEIPQTHILTTIDIKDFSILEFYQDIFEKKMAPNGQSVCTYFKLLMIIRERRKEEDIQKAFTEFVDF
jgi:hypothetical protein